MKKVDGKDNVADALTKHLERDGLEKHMQWTGQEISEGRCGVK